MTTRKTRKVDTASQPVTGVTEVSFATLGRIPVLDVTPVISNGARKVKAVVNETIQICATVFREGHDEVAADVLVKNSSGDLVNQVRMHLIAPGTDRFCAEISLPDVGDYTFEIHAWSDVIGTWLHRAHKKIPADIDVELEFAEGQQVLSTLEQNCVNDKAALKVIAAAQLAFADKTRPTKARLAVVDHVDFQEVIQQYPIRELLSVYGPFPIRVERQRALFGSWYEFFPRSEGATKAVDGTWTSGNFKTAAKRLPAIAAAGFDVLYLPPIHPIGTAYRKGPNNTLTPGPQDPGSPWAIGATTGGHDAIHPDLGTQTDFVEFVKKAEELGIEIALDLALQASPDHPWVKSNPEWFTTRADGTIAYAENPPKKYQDIYPINFDNDPEGIFQEVLRVVRHWMSLGVRIFRVDNPHTKPVAFWERLIGTICDSDPDVIFLAEAFTKPAMMRVLGEVGFQQSYTYFTWRNHKTEIIEYLTELSGPAAAYMRPNFFVNTPDILPEFLQYGGPNAFAIRAALAATTSPTWGMYAGFEIFEHVAVKPGSEEYLNSEKYEYRPRDWANLEAAGKTLTPFITSLNQIRREHPALQELRNIRFHDVQSDSMLCFSKQSGDDTILVVLTLDPAQPREATVNLNMPALGLNWEDSFPVIDELTGQKWTWTKENFVRLDPHEYCAHILYLPKAGGQK